MSVGVTAPSRIPTLVVRRVVIAISAPGTDDFPLNQMPTEPFPDAVAAWLDGYYRGQADGYKNGHEDGEDEATCEGGC